MAQEGIPETNISGRFVANVLKEKPFYKVIDGVNRPCYDLWQLCHSPLIDKWAKFSPLTANGGKWASPVGEDNFPHTAIKDYTYYIPNPNYDANLSQFGHYIHGSSENLVVRTVFPENLWSDAENPIPRGMYLRWLNDNYMGLEEVFKEHVVNGKVELYPCVAIGNDWCTGDKYVANPLFPNAPMQVLNTPNQMTFCLTDTEKKYWGDPMPARAKFYSLKAKPDTVVTMLIPTKSKAIQYNVNILSAAYGSGTFAIIKRKTDGVRGIYLTIARQDGQPLPSNNGWSIYIYETERNTPTGAFIDTPLTYNGTQFISLEDTFESNVSGVKDLKYELKLDGKVVKSGSFPQVK